VSRAEASNSSSAAAVTPARNRVTPLGEIVAIPLRGAWTGNRGILHRGREIVRFHASDLWITCALEFRGRRREQWQPHHYTFLYFHDEAVSLAAGHRPCAECRRDSYNAYRSAWADGLGATQPPAKEINRQLHRERSCPGLIAAGCTSCPGQSYPAASSSGSTALLASCLDGSLVEWTHAGYGAARPRPARGVANVITPPSTVAALQAGYSVQIDESARI
jgi:hypothetical protein